MDGAFEPSGFYSRAFYVPSIWDLVDTGQSAVWTDGSNAQTSSWTLISNNQSVGLTSNDTSQTASWSTAQNNQTNSWANIPTV